MFIIPITFFGGLGAATVSHNTMGFDPLEIQHLKMIDSTDFNLSTAFSFSAWIYPTDISLEPPIYTQRGSSLNTVEFFLNSSGKLRVTATYGGALSFDLTSTSTVPTDAWSQVGFQVDGNAVKLMYNGAFEATSDTVDVAPTDIMDSARIGSTSVSPVFFDGSIAAVLGAQTVWTEANLIELYGGGIPQQYDCYTTNITDTATFFLPLNDGVTTGQEIVDQTGNGNDAFLFGDTDPVLDGQELDFAVCAGIATFTANTALLDGSTTYFTAGDVLNVGTNDYSYVAWFKTSASATQMIISKTDATAGEAIDCYITSSGTLNLRCQVDASNFRDQSTTTTYNDGNWHLVVAFCNRSTGTWHMRVDDVNPSLAPPFSSGVITGNADNNAILSVGQRDNGASRQVFDGSLGFAGIAIGSSLVDDSTELYNAGVATCFSDLSAPIKAKFTSSGDFWELANWTGHTGGELTGQANANTLTNTGSTPFTGTGLTVECS